MSDLLLTLLLALVGGSIVAGIAYRAGINAGRREQAWTIRVLRKAVEVAQKERERETARAADLQRLLMRKANVS